MNGPIRGLLLGLGLLMASVLPGAAQGPSEQKQATAIFGGGCFWCVEADFDKVPGVLSTTSGYIGGSVPNPTYQQVSAGQKRLAEASKSEMAQRFKPRLVVTEIASAMEFYPAEDYHQDYYRKNELKYKFYRWSCGRDARLEELWGAEAGGLKSS